ncbi:MAG: acyl carrier protein [bacterium]|nr:acyl carrier protein [bacterium]
MSIDQALADAFGEVLGYAGPLADDLTADQVAGWDSLAHLSLIEDLEQRLKVRFRVEEMTEMTSVGLIRRGLVRHGVANEET